jgi:FkbM family methyltransferase
VPITSYAQNFEDVILARAFSGSTGFYVDVGANDPDIDNVTRVFYDRGWSGINIEPLATRNAELRKKRKRDINLEIAVGDEEGSIIFYEIGKWHGYSTTDAAIAEQHRKDGLKVVEHNVPLRKLSTVLDEYAKGRAIDFLKIDVEGTELSVLRGANFKRHRPKIIVLESKMPITINMIDRIDEVQDRAKEYTGFLAPFGYLLVYHDGLNAFFLAEEHHDLKRVFLRPPGSFDKITHDASVRPYKSKLKRERQIFASLTLLAVAMAIVWRFWRF